MPKPAKIMLTSQADEKAVHRAKNQVNLYTYLQKHWVTNQLIENIKYGSSKS